MFVSHYEFVKYASACYYKYSTGTNILFRHPHQSKQKSFAPPSSIICPWPTPPPKKIFGWLRPCARVWYLSKLNLQKIFFSCIFVLQLITSCSELIVSSQVASMMHLEFFKLGGKIQP